MSVTQDFQTNALYPGGEGKCGVGIHDPYPDGIPSGNVFKVNLDVDAFHGLSLNLEAWNTSLDIDVTIDDFYGLDIDLTGQYTECEGFIANDTTPQTGLEVFVFDGEPVGRVCGTGVLKIESDFATNSQTTENRSVILPSASINFGIINDDSDDGSPITQTTTVTVDSVDIGDATITRTSFSPAGEIGSYQIKVQPIYARLLGDGTVDLYVEVFFGMEYLTDQEMQLFNTDDSGEWPVGFSFSEAITITLFGQSVTAYWLTELESFVPAVFNFSFNATASTLYTYP
jgi:hypothetical protein